MSRAINAAQKSAANSIRIRAVLANEAQTDWQQAVRDAAEVLTADIEGSLKGRTTEELAKGGFHSIVRAVLERRLSGMFAFEAPPTDSASLPVGNLKPSEVIEQRKVRLSLASLYRYSDAGKFYCVTPPGQSNGREFPAWQFVEPVPALLPDVLSQMKGDLKTEVHAFLVSAQDDLNELAPAEVLAGKRFAGHPPMHESQIWLLRLSGAERLRRVLEVLQDVKESMAERSAIANGQGR